MAFYEHDIVFYGSDNMPEDDASVVGGAVDLSKLIVFGDISPNGLLDYVSSDPLDTSTTITVTGRDPTGAAVDEIATLTGATLVAGAQTYERLLKGIVGGTTAQGDIAAISHTPVVSAHTLQSAGIASSPVAAFAELQAGDGAGVDIGMIIRITNNTPVGVQNQMRRIIRKSGDFIYVNRDWDTTPSASTVYSIHQGFLFDYGPNQITHIRRMFYNAASNAPGGASKTLYEKIFATNTNAVTALIAAGLTKTLDPSQGTLNFGLCKTIDDVNDAVNRVTLPVNDDASAITFTSGVAPQSQAVPSPGNITVGGSQGIWCQFVLPAGLPSAKLSFNLRQSGASA